jgi:hypothetical protein
MRLSWKSGFTLSVPPTQVLPLLASAFALGQVPDLSPGQQWPPPCLAPLSPSPPSILPTAGGALAVWTDSSTGRVSWLTPVIPARQEAEEGGSRAEAILGKKKIKQDPI